MLFYIYFIQDFGISADKIEEIKKHNLNALRVYKGKTIKFLENFSMYFLFIDFLRLFKRIKNKTKQFIKTILGII